MATRITEPRGVLVLLVGLLLVPVLGVGRPNVEREAGRTVRSAQQLRSLAAGCDNPQAQIDIDINNVRARLFTGGDMWWDLFGTQSAYYYVPKDGGVSAFFAGSIWIGGLDPSGNVRIAAQTYRQSGVDFWTGPLLNGSIDAQTCREWDRHWKVTSDEIDAHRADYAEDGLINKPIPLSIREWPAVGNPFIGIDDKFIARPYGLAPFVDVDGDGLYNPAAGDYPDVPGDMAIWWVFNDMGNIHTETQGLPIGIEVQALAFAFQTTDEINNMTFYRYTLINHATTSLTQTYVAKWVDADLGCYLDDYVGCDTALNLGYVYNGDNSDENCGSKGYTATLGMAPPIAGTDFFKGPWSPEDSTYLGMSAFVYYNNDFSVIGNPETFSHFYNYLIGKWKDGQPITCGGNGRGGAQPCKYMYPSDPRDPTGWSECAVGNQPFDRRYLMVSGPFTLEPGAVNEVIVGAIWVPQSSQAGCGANIDILRKADEKAQLLFDIGFKLLDGPTAPNLTVRELDRKLILHLWNPSWSNNANENYMAIDSFHILEIRELASLGRLEGDSFYRFEGYLIYQLADPTVTVSELNDLTRARLIAQVDVENGITKIVNWYYDSETDAWIPRVEVEGADKGLRHTFEVATDAFSTTADNRLVNYRPYYFMVLAYAYNNFKTFNPTDSIPGQPQPFLLGRRNVRVYVGIPHKPSSEGGIVLNSSYGRALAVRSLSGGASNGYQLAIDGTNILSLLGQPSGMLTSFYYSAGKAPVEVKVYDPLAVKSATLRLVVTAKGIGESVVLAGDTVFYIEDVASGRIVYAGVATQESYTLTVLSPLYRWNEYVLQDYGISIRLKRLLPLSVQVAQGKLELQTDQPVAIDYSDPSYQWLVLLSDIDEVPFLNWIRAGNDSGAFAVSDYFVSGGPRLDPFEVSEKEPYQGIVAPYFLANIFDNAGQYLAPGVRPGFFSDPANSGLYNRYKNFVLRNFSWDSLRSVYIEITPDKEKWSQTFVLEMHHDITEAEGRARRFGYRRAPSVDKNGNILSGQQGGSWFPGYAVDLETGRRLIVLFGESSWDEENNGKDMLWNPTDRVLKFTGQSIYATVGGNHFIYVLNLEYTQANLLLVQSLLEGINNNDPTADSTLIKYFMWVMVPLWNQQVGEVSYRSMRDGLVPNTVRITVTVPKPFYRDHRGYPVYEFSTEGMEPVASADKAREMLDSIFVVPNPYYAFSEYEESRLQNVVKIINLPPGARVTIYNLSGTRIREFTYQAGTTSTYGGDALTGSIDWDLTNSAGVPISSGLYLIHVRVEGVGERIIKFFCVMRPADLESF